MVLEIQAETVQLPQLVIFKLGPCGRGLESLSLSFLIHRTYAAQRWHLGGGSGKSFPLVRNDDAKFCTSSSSHAELMLFS